jgi:hypothetical protein
MHHALKEILNMKPSHPYVAYESCPAWQVLDHAIRDLIENRDLQETTSHAHVVGYLVKQLADAGVIEACGPDREMT